ncbi:hypothetical protein A4A49_38989 [Nicotiana attenuata]|uniref:Uncharacterized protein n=1 Tax=Nicotiana attenuata TaxID=49451 RepID=A0A1J6K714_NICAT|nr:hypothetical protein A4A49_38989 [Nicotiana attenuata]
MEHKRFRILSSTQNKTKANTIYIPKGSSNLRRPNKGFEMNQLRKKNEEKMISSPASRGNRFQSSKTAILTA